MFLNDSLQCLEESCKYLKNLNLILKINRKTSVTEPFWDEVAALKPAILLKNYRGV